MAATDGTGQGLVEFLEWAGSRGELNPTTAQAISIASRKILAIDGDLDAIKIESLDTDSILERFQNLHRTDYSESSMSTYQSRFRSAIAMYKAWLDKRSDWKSLGPSAKKNQKPRDPGSDGKRATAPSTPPAELEPNQASSEISLTTEMIPYEVPLRPDLRVRLVLPVDLTTKDAERISTFVRSLAFDPEPEMRSITQRGVSDG